LQVAHHDAGLADVLRNQPPEHFVTHAFGEEFRGRNTQSLLIDFGGVRRITAGRHAADIEMVAERADDGDTLSL